MKNFVLLTGTVVLVLALTEGLLYLFPALQAENGAARRIYCGLYDTRIQPHPVFGYTEIPNNVYWEMRHEADGWALHAYNAEGFRDMHDSGSRTAIVLGDSLTRGSLVDNDQTYEFLLDSWLPDLSFANFGVGGFGTGDELIVYREVAKKIEHGLVILGYYSGNDLRNNFKFDLDAVDAPGRLAAERTPPGEPDFEDKLKEALNDIRRHVRVANLAATGLLKLWHATFGTKIGAQPTLDPKVIDEGVAKTRILLQRLAALTIEHGADLLIVFIPSWNELSGLAEREFQVQIDSITALSGALPNVHVIDMRQAFLAAGLDRVYGRRDKHAAPYGHYLIAREVYRWLNREWRGGPLAEGPPPGFAERPRRTAQPDCRLADEMVRAFKSPVSSAGKSAAE